MIRRSIVLAIAAGILAVAVPAVLASATGWLIESGRVPLERALDLMSIATTLFLVAVILAIMAAIRRNERATARLAAIVESSEDAIIGKTTDGVIISWNRAAERLFGYPEAEALGRTMHIVLPEDRVAEEEAILARIRRGEPVDHFETVRRNAQGDEFPVSTTVSPIRTASGQVIGASSITRDISAQVKKDTELRRSNAELEQFAYVASHDLQEPLRMVANYVELLGERYRGQLDERADKYIAYASDGAFRMQRLVSDLLAYSRIGSQGRPLEPVMLGPVIERVLASLAGPIGESQAQVAVAEMPYVMGDEVQLGQLFQNLLANAIKFRGEKAPVIHVAARREGADWHISVADNGIGMDPRFHDRIFQMFQRLHPRERYEGSGIGLALAKRIVERHEGTIRAESVEGEGATFHFTLKSCPKGSLP